MVGVAEYAAVSAKIDTLHGQPPELPADDMNTGTVDCAPNAPICAVHSRADLEPVAAHNGGYTCARLGQ